MSDVLLESRWGDTKDALLEGLEGNRRNSMSVVLENTRKYLKEAASTGASASGNIATLNRVILPVIRRVMPTVIANEIVGVQPMTGPTGLIFAMKSRFGSQAGAEALFNEADTDFSARDAAGDTGSPDAQSGTNPATLNDSPSAGTYTTGSGMTTAQAETLGDGSDEFAEMAFSIDKVTVTAKSRALKAEYTMELAQA